MGNLAALFLVEILSDAIDEIITNAKASNPVVFLAELQKQEEADSDYFRRTEFPDLVKDLIPEVAGDGDFDWSTLVSGPSFCHTALIPAEIRKKGILTESLPVDIFSDDTGAIPRSIADAWPAVDGDMMRLVYEDADKDPKFHNCSEMTNVDFKEYFYVNSEDGWKKVVVPNDAEVEEYGTGQPVKGMLAFCLKWCNWNSCPPGNLRLESILVGIAQMEVNGMPVTNVTRMNAQVTQDCGLMSNAEGHSWIPNDHGRFEIRARVTEAGNYLRFSSFVVW
jgi:hypothetical protein